MLGILCTSDHPVRKCWWTRTGALFLHDSFSTQKTTGRLLVFGIELMGLYSDLDVAQAILNRGDFKSDGDSRPGRTS